MTKTNNHNRPLNRTFATLLGLTLCAASYGCVEDMGRDDANQGDSDRAESITQFTKLFIIGDSLSDTHRMGSGYIPYCPNSKRGYWNRRFSNGFLWIDYLMQDNPALADKVSNYAVGGSGILKRYGSGIIGKTRKQAEDLVSDNPASDVANSMVIVWAGSNDIKEASKSGGAADFGHQVFNTLRDETIEYLGNQGVDHFVLVGLPRIDLVPIGKTWSEAEREWVEIATNTFNDDLEAYAQAEGHVYLDVAEKIGEVLSGEVTSVNMTDLANPCHDGPNCVEQGDSPGSYKDRRCEEKMFFDRVHPTTGAHCGIAKWMEQAISTQYEISGGDQDLESCARRVQTEEAKWGALPTNHSQPRSPKFKVETALTPGATCESECVTAGGATWNGESGYITLPDSSTVGYCTCEGGNGGVHECPHGRCLTSVPALYQAALNGSNFEFGFNSVDAIQLTGAPSDTDADRWAMVHDGNVLYEGGTYRMFHMAQGRDDTLYRFTWEPNSKAYDYDGTFTIEGLKDYVDTSSFAVTHGDNSSTERLWFLDQTGQKIVHYYRGENDSSFSFFNSDHYEIENPAQADLSGWAMLDTGFVDGVGGKGMFLYGWSPDQQKIIEWRLVTTDDNVARKTGEYGVTGFPAEADLSDFGMMHDGSTSRFYVRGASL